MEYIPRALEERLRQLARTTPAVLVTGPRQVGKSTLLKRVFPERRYISLDDPFLEQQAREEGGMLLTLNPPPVTIDEVQYAPQLFRHLKMECDSSGAPGLFCLSGSQHFELMKNVSESLSGRIAIVELGGLSLREIQRSSFADPFIPTLDYVRRRQPTAAAPRNIWEVIHRGAYPALQNPERDWASYYADYIKTYLERDLRALTAVHDLSAFQRFLVAAAARTAQVLNCANIADEVGKDAVTIRNWLSILEASGLVFLLEPYAASTLKRAIKTPKLFFRDTGLVCYLTRWLTPESAAYGAMNGHIFETFAISEILKSFSNLGLDYRHFLSYYRGRDRIKRKVNGETISADCEIDLIIEADGVLHPVEVKQNSNVPATAAAAAFPVLDDIPNKRRGTGAILCNCPHPGLLRDNLLQLPVWYV